MNVVINRFHHQDIWTNTYPEFMKATKMENLINCNSSSNYTHLKCLSNLNLLGSNIFSNKTNVSWKRLLCSISISILQRRHERKSHPDRICENQITVFSQEYISTIRVNFHRRHPWDELAKNTFSPDVSQSTTK